MTRDELRKRIAHILSRNVVNPREHWTLEKADAILFLFDNQLADKDARIAELKGALKPFAGMAKEWTPYNDEIIFSIGIKGKDLRRAAEVLKEGKG